MIINQPSKFMLKLLFLAILGSCSSTPKVQEFSDTANSADEITLLEKDLQKAKEDQVDVLAPTSYTKANEALESARNNQKNSKPSKTILHEVAVGRASLNSANQFAKVARTNLENVVVARQAAIKANAPKLFTNDFQTADTHLRKVTAQIEDNDLSNVDQNRSPLQKEYMDVELKAIQKEYLGEARATIDKAIKEEANDYAAQSLATAEKSYSDALAFIVANRYEHEAVGSKSAKAKEDADHLLKITRASKTGKTLTSEQSAILLESQKSKTQNEKNQLNAQKNLTKDLATETENLKADREFNQSFIDAQAAFSDSEAEVYRQGNQLVIRLRALAFPTNQSVLRGSNFPLLSKVGKVISGFENSTVVVEGHTDSNGSKATNQKLSTARAEAVSSYLVANDAITQDKISVAGYGSDRPLASNKSSQGKAQNRRVDIVITPAIQAH